MLPWWPWRERIVIFLLFIILGGVAVVGLFGMLLMGYEVRNGVIRRAPPRPTPTRNVAPSPSPALPKPSPQTGLVEGAHTLAHLE